MAGTAGTLEILAKQMGLVLQPLQTQLTSDNLLPFLAELGLEFPPQLLLETAFMSAVNVGATAAGAIPPLLTQLATDITAKNQAGIVQDGLQLIQQIGKTIAALDTIGTELGKVAGILPGMNAGEVTTFANQLASNLLSYQLISYIENTQPGLVGIANLFGIVNYLPNPGVAGDPVHPPYVIRRLQLSSLGTLLTKPASLLKGLYGWGDAGFDGKQLLQRLSDSLDLLGVPSPPVPPIPGTTFETPLFSAQVLPGSPPGIVLTLADAVPSGFDITVPLTGVWSVKVLARLPLPEGATASITPPATVRLKPPTGTLTGLLSTDLIALAPDTSDPLILIGQTGGSRVEANSCTFGAGLNVTWDSASGSGSADPLLTFGVTGGKAVIDASQGDGFLQIVLSGIHVEAGFDLSGTWRADTGIHIDAGGQLEINLPLHLELGPVSLRTLYLVGGVSGGAVTLEVAAALGLTLGPIAATVDRIGAKGALTFPPKNGNLGPADLQVLFKPPNGLGIQIDAGPVVGGGYISFDPDKGQYAGVLDVSIIEIITVKIIAVLDTIMPDGSPGFSFLLIITFDLPPIQLSFGFTLNGVGGLGGVNRTMNIDALHTGFRAHALNSIMFPPDPVKNAPQIISNIRNFFPPAQGRYLFGPMLEIGWGTPTLITLSVGVILEVPDPIRLALLGLISSGLPTLDLPLIELHIDVLGTLDFGTKTLEIDGSLYDSHVLIYSLAGDLFFRLNWGDNPAFIFSLGGFHPHFNTAGLNIPRLQRMSVSIGNGDNPRISSNSYFAITSNTLQFGANVEAYASAAGFSVHGYLGFDVLIIYSPFSFEFDFSVGFDISFEGTCIAGLSINGLFSGPRPWHLHGDASFHILFFSVSASIDLTWGDSTPAILPAKPVRPDLLAALEAVSNWSATLPNGAAQGVTLATPPPGADTLRVHPMGTLAVKENVVPLDLPITRYGNATPSDGNYFSISKVQSNGQDEQISTFTDYFATGQFLALSDADKLSKPSFERYDAGVTIGSSAIVNGADSPRTVNYEERYVPDPNGFSVFSRRYAMSASVHLALTRQGAGYLSAVKNSGLVKYANGPAQVAVSAADATYVIAGTEDLTIRSDIASGGGISYFHAQAALSTYVAAHPGEAASLQILPLHEVGL